MNVHLWTRSLLALAAAAVLVVSGCGKTDDKPAKKDTPKGSEVAKGKHEGWWCDEHGIPEEECSMCSDKVLKAFKDKGELCKEHPDRAASQCFICKPELKEKYAKLYRDKFGKEPPPPEANMPKKDDKK